MTNIHGHDHSIEKMLSRALALNQITISAQQQTQLVTYLQLLLRWNQVYNLTAITNLSDMVYLHIIDSLIAHPYLQGKEFLDVGSGAGLPGVPLAIIGNKDCQWTLLDKNSKKTRFLTQVVAELQLSQVKVVKNRCEDFKPDQCFDTILARAFTQLSIFADICSHLLCTNGKLLAMKGQYPKKELDELPQRFSTVITKVMIKGRAIERHMVEIRESTSG